MIVISIINNNTYNINKGRGRRTERRESKGENKMSSVLDLLLGKIYTIIF